MSRFVAYRISTSKQNEQTFRNLKSIQNFITHPSSTIVCGITGSGKTTVVHNIIDIGLNHEIWDQIIVISPDNDLEYEEFLNGDNQVILTDLPKDLDSFKNKMEEINEETEIKLNTDMQTLLVIDDFHSESTSNKFIRQIFTKNRHYGVSLVFCTQNFNDLPVTVKTNSHYYYFMRDCNPQILSNVESKCGVTNLKRAYETFLKENRSNYPWLFYNRKNKVCFDNEKNKYELDLSKSAKNFDLVTDNMFRNNLNIIEKRELRKEILNNFMETIDSEMVNKLIGSRRPKKHDEEIKKYVPVQYWRFWSIR